MNHLAKWEFWADRGGTFTDVLARHPDGRMTKKKLLSENPSHYPDALSFAIKEIMQLGQRDPIPHEDIAMIKMGTTIATNALLERKGAPVLLLTTKGFQDALEIGHQARSDLFALQIKKADMLYAAVIDVQERILTDGLIESPLDELACAAKLQKEFDKGLRHLAVAFMNSYKNPTHEKIAHSLAKDIGFETIELSHQTSNLMRFLPRANTAMVNAYLKEPLSHYLAELTKNLQLPPMAEGQLYFMQSSAGLIRHQEFQGKDAILSGPAGGIVGAAKTAQMAGFDKIITFDMGGTSTDVALYDGAFQRSFETNIGGLNLQTPTLAIETVAAGGGSILRIHNDQLFVGPASAGAHPGPLSYGNKGPLTITDANVMLGKLQPAYFPAIFGKRQNKRLDSHGVKQAFAKMAKQMAKPLASDLLAEGFVKIANQTMADAIKRVSITKGQDPKEFCLCSFGGAGGQHACQIADLLDISTIHIHPAASLLSAYGIGLSDMSHSLAATSNIPLDEKGLAQCQPLFGSLKAELISLANSQGLFINNLRFFHHVHLRYEETDSCIEVKLLQGDDHHRLFDQFTQNHVDRYGYRDDQAKVIIDRVSLTMVKAAKPFQEQTLKKTKQPHVPPHDHVDVFLQSRWTSIPLYKREQLTYGHSLLGPVLIIEETQTILVEDNWLLKINQHGHLIITKKKKDIARKPAGEITAIDVTIFANKYMAIAEQMGETLRQTARSVNMKERLDFSCAIFDQSGDLLANAPHVPVHLGSMDMAVKTIIERNRDRMKPGDHYVINAPYNGGTHLPDITVITPVYSLTHHAPIFFTASRGHHADVGGLAPGSMSPKATDIHEEGVYIDNILIQEQGQFDFHKAHSIFTSGDYPPRNSSQNIADLKAQIAANIKGNLALQKIIGAEGLDRITPLNHAIQTISEQSIRHVIKQLEDGKAHIKMDNDLEINVALTIDKKAGEATIDFTGTSDQSDTNFNAPLPITRAVVLYVFRTLTNDEIPMTAGCLRPINIIVPKANLLNPEKPKAVVAGNVETSQVIANALYQAIGCLGSAQGTMNNFTFGDDTYQYYETICSGSPAGDGFDGTAAIQSHMTNSRLTDPEILERRYPILLEEFSIRRGSGGKGETCAGDGVLRRIRFLKPMKAALLTNNRVNAPHGTDGGLEGEKGQNWHILADGARKPLPSCCEIDLKEDEKIEIRTPTGGGFGKPKK